MSRKIIDLTFGQLATALCIKQHQFRDEEELKFLNEENSGYFENNGLADDKGRPLLVSVNLPEDDKLIKCGFGKASLKVKSDQTLFDTFQNDPDNPFAFLQKSNVQLFDKSLIRTQSNYGQSFDNFFSGRDLLTGEVKDSIEDTI